MAGSSITPVDKLRIVKWLVKQRNSLGGFSSTQDTCVGLQALARYAGEIYSGEYNLQIAASAPEFDTTFSVTDENQLVLQRTQLENLASNKYLNYMNFFPNTSVEQYIKTHTLKHNIHKTLKLFKICLSRSQ